MVYISTSASVCVIAMLTVGRYSSLSVVSRSFLLSLYFFFSVWGFHIKSGNYGIGLFASMAVLLCVGWSASFWVFLSVLAAVFAFWLRMIRSCRSSWKIGYREIVTLIVLGACLAAVAISGMRSGYANFLVDYQVRNGGLHLDSLVLMACANMMNHYGANSMGVHGLVPAGYHVFSNLLYAMAGNALGIKIYQVYGYCSSIVFIPLLFLSILALGEEVVPSKSGAGAYAAFLVLISIFVGFWGRGNFSRYGLLWDSYFVSESYCIGLIFLLAFISYLLSSRSKSIVISSLFLLVLSTCKVSVGFVGLAFLVVYELFLSDEEVPASVKEKHHGGARIHTVKGASRHNRAIRNTAIYLLLYGCILSRFPIGANFPASSHRPAFEFMHFMTAYMPGDIIARLGTAVAVLVLNFMHYFFVWVALSVALIYYLTDRESYERICRIALFMAIAAVIGFVSMSMPIGGGSGYYFSNVSMFISIPVILSLKHYISRDTRETKSHAATIAAAAIILFGICGSLCYGIPYVANGIQRLSRQVEVAKSDAPVSGYTGQLQRISEDNSTKNCLVYIPKKEKDYWDRDSQCGRPALLIPALSERPALFGLPSKSCMSDGYFLFNKFDERIIEESAAPDIQTQTLCRETRRLGFDGYVEATSSSYARIGCR
ncbi:MAG: hypothetical protein NTZ78_11745 [Candidatus Aureabacteria bacterium]|nr:hypothetical protein [Candidatus Auribacterota bacterium]